MKFSPAMWFIKSEPILVILSEFDKWELFIIKLMVFAHMYLLHVLIWIQMETTITLGPHCILFHQSQ